MPHLTQSICKCGNLTQITKFPDFQISTFPNFPIKIAAMDRRDFLRLSGSAVAAGALAANRKSAVEAQAPVSGPVAAPPMETVRIAYVGIGGQGSGHVNNLLKIPGCRITAVCDVRPERTEWATKAITAAGHPPPTAYTRGPRDFERLCETEDLDLVYNATPWEF